MDIGQLKVTLENIQGMPPNQQYTTKIKSHGKKMGMPGVEFKIW